MSDARFEVKDTCEMFTKSKKTVQMVEQLEGVTALVRQKKCENMATIWHFMLLCEGDSHILILKDGDDSAFFMIKFTISLQD